MTEIIVERLVHDFPGGVRALDGVDLELNAGERVALVGQNGSGKTTLVRHLNGLLRPTSGRVTIDGRDAAQLTAAALSRVVGLVFQDPDRQIFAGTVRSEVEFGPRNVGLRGHELTEAVAEALSAVGQADLADANPYDLGAARRKLLTIASVLAMRTPVLVLDEPTTGQDLRGAAIVREVVRRVADEGRSVVAVSHDMDFVAGTFARVLVMRAGRVILDGPPSEVFAAARWADLRSTYLQPPLAARVGEELKLGSTPTDEELVRALAAGEAQ